LFERAVFAHLATFSEGPPKTSFTVAAGTTPPHPVSVANRNPY
jgi:UDP-N-acetylglucosamine 3-dehydrogenase